MNKKSGKAGTLVSPTAPKEAQEADVADPGEVAELKLAQRAQGNGKYGTVKIVPFTPPPPGEHGGAAALASSAVATEEVKTVWIEIELVGEDDKPIPGQRYAVILPDGKVAEGTLDQHGWARVEGFETGNCKINFPDLDKDAWEFIESVGPRPAEAAT